MNVFIKLLLSHIWLFATPWIAAGQTSHLSLSPRVCSNSCPLSQQCHPTISSSVVLFSSCPQSFPASGSFPVSQLFASGGQSFGASPLASVLPMNSFRVYWFDLLAAQGPFKSPLQPHSSEGSVFWCSAFFMAQLSRLHLTTGKTIVLTRWTLVSKVLSVFLTC